MDDQHTFCTRSQLVGVLDYLSNSKSMEKHYPVYGIRKYGCRSSTDLCLGGIKILVRGRKHYVYREHYCICRSSRYVMDADLGIRGSGELANIFSAA